MVPYKMLGLSIVLSLLIGCSGQDDSPDWSIDSRSYNLGAIGAFAEMVESGVKRLALSAPMEPSEMDAIIEEATRIAAAHNVEVFREDDFLVTDLFPAEVTEGKHVLLICSDLTYDVYENMKAEKERLVNIGEYTSNNRERIARLMGELLSYPNERIDYLLTQSGN